MGVMVTHFGLRLNNSRAGFRLTRDTYLPTKRTVTRVPHRDPYADPTVEVPADAACYLGAAMCACYELDADGWHRKVTEDTYELLAQQALENFDLNMAFYQRLDLQQFTQAVDELQRAYPMLQPVDDLNTFARVSGLYVLILDDYRQLYVGQSQDITKRIRQHWTSSKDIATLVFGEVATSRLSIDAFRALDTTRILVWPYPDPDLYEGDMLRTVPDDYVANRIAGGLPMDSNDLILATGAGRRLIAPTTAIISPDAVV